MNINPLRSARSLFIATLPVLALSAGMTSAEVNYESGTPLTISELELQGTVQVFDMDGSPTSLIMNNTMIHGSLHTHHNSSVIGSNITTTVNFGVYNNSQAHIQNSTIGNDFAGYTNSSFTVRNSTIQGDLITSGSSVGTVSATGIQGQVLAYNNSMITLTEGSLPADGITTYNTALVVLQAESFDQEFTILQGTGTITGQLSTGERFSVDYQTHDESGIQLVGTTSVPAPGALAVLGLAALPLSRSRRR